VGEIWSGAEASGAVAIEAGRAVGFLVGRPSPNAVWGPNVWVEAAGQAVEAGPDAAETLRELYAAAAARWVEEGRRAHYVLVPADEPTLIDAWFRLGFGQQHVHAIREAPSADIKSARHDVVIRPARRVDIDALATLDLVLPEHQGRSPVFSSGPVPTRDEAMAEWVESIDDDDYTVFVAERDGVVVGSAIGCSVEKSRAHLSLARPDNAGFLAFAAVLPEARGSGIGRALGEAVLAWIANAGYRSAVTDWRATNLLSSRTWPRLGFRPTFLRLHRLIGY
jgi:GNAT superfamily N-acetyltransferase